MKLGKIEQAYTQSIRKHSKVQTELPINFYDALIGTKCRVLMARWI